jgi:pyruvyltransferase
MSAELKRIHAFWCRIPSRANFGDALTPWLIRRLTGQHPNFVRPDDTRHKYLAVGSIIGYAGAASTVWGSGIMNRDDRVSPEAELLSVRGPLTRARAIECGASCPEIYGDPALLLPRLYRPRSDRRYGCGVTAHFSDFPCLSAVWRNSSRLRLIDIQDSVETVIDRIATCELVASSSLHGIITSHAYGVPAVWVKFRDLPSGDDSKFYDYFLSLGLAPPTPLRLNYNHIDEREFLRRAIPPPASFDSDALWQACPFRGCQ